VVKERGNGDEASDQNSEHKTFKICHLGAEDRSNKGTGVFMQPDAVVRGTFYII
jgi:hypothetical protein